MLVIITDTNVSSVTIDPRNITVITGTSNVAINCTITLNRAIGPNHTALSVTWLGPNLMQHTDVQNIPATTDMTKTFHSVLIIQHIASSSAGQYYCEAHLVGKESVQSKSSSIRVLGENVCMFFNCYSTIAFIIPVMELYYNDSINTASFRNYNIRQVPEPQSG